MLARLKLLLPAILAVLSGCDGASPLSLVESTDPVRIENEQETDLRTTTDTPTSGDNLTGPESEQTEPDNIDSTSIYGRGCDYIASETGATSASLQTSINGSDEVQTSDLAIRIQASINDGADASVGMRLGLEIYDRLNYEPYSGNGSVSVRTLPIELTGGDQLVVIAGDKRHVLEDKPISNGRALYEGYGNYFTNIEGLQAGDCVRVAIERSNGQIQALDTILNIPSIPAMLSPTENAVYALDDEVTIEWADAGDDGEVTAAGPLEYLSTGLHCIDETGELAELAIDHEPFELSGSTATSHTATVAELAAPLFREHYGAIAPLNLSGCELVFGFVPDISSTVEINHDPALYNSIKIDYYYRPGLRGDVFERTIIIQ